MASKAARTDVCSLPTCSWGQWKKSSDSGKLERAFCHFIMSPICKMFEAIMEDKKQKIQKMLAAVGVTLKGDEKVSSGRREAIFIRNYTGLRNMQSLLGKL